MGQKIYWFRSIEGPEPKTLGGPCPSRENAIEEAEAYIRSTRAMAFPEHIQVVYEENGETFVDDWTWATRDRS